MDLQALRYAAMISAMTFDRLCDVFARHLMQTTPGQAEQVERATRGVARRRRRRGRPAVREVGIILVSAGFGTEITTTVLWLNEVYGLDITCIRLTPYRVDDRLLLDITQLIPLPEADEFTVKLRRREQATRKTSDGRDWTQYVIITPEGEAGPLRKRWAVLELVTALHRAGVSGSEMAAVMPHARWRSAPGNLSGDELVKTFTRRDPKFTQNHGRWFTDRPLHDPDCTWILSKMWGAQTGQTLDKLLELAPDDGYADRPT